ncbi:MAG: aspartate aminotransferase family protein [Methylomicrobium sp.]|nr:aspartate aminotransferase family protein [Methylomicrobium sp.]
MSDSNVWDIDLKFLSEYEERHTHSYDLASEYMNPKLVEVMDILGFNKHYAKAEGNYLYDNEGKAYLDMHSGEGFASLGHNHPAINRALIKALDSNLPDGVQIHHSTLSGLLAKNLCKRLPDGLDRVFFTNSGTETVEAALKFARAASKRHRLLSCESGYHGLTYGALSVSSEEYFRKGFGPLLPGCDRVPFNDLERLEEELSARDVAAFIVEPIQGRAVTMPSHGYFKEVERLCRRYGTFLIFDEIQSGLGRTGRWFALDHWGVEPDFVLVAKALSGGHMPVGAMISRRSIFDKVFNTLDRCYVHHSTYARNRLAMVAGLATLEVMENDKLVENADVMGKRLMEGLNKLKERYSLLKDVRGMGLMIGFELGCPDSIRSKMEWKLIHAASAGLFPQLIVIPLHRDHGVITMASGHNDVIKLLPTMVITEKEVDHFLNAMETILRNSQEGNSENWKTIYQIAKRTIKGGD